MAKLEDVRIGSWLQDSDGIYEVISEYDAYHGWYLVKEVIFDDDSEFHLDDKECRMTKQEVKRADLIF